MDDLCCALEPEKHSILTSADSDRVRKLADSAAVVPTQLLPLLTPTLTDFLYCCRQRTFVSLEERAFYNSYFIKIAERYQYINGDKNQRDELVKVLSKNNFQSVEEMLTLSSQWIPPLGYKTGSRFLSTQCMTAQSEKGMKRLCDPALMEDSLINQRDEMIDFISSFDDEAPNGHEFNHRTADLVASINAMLLLLNEDGEGSASQQ